TYKDRCYRSHLDDAESAGLITAAYHYLRNPSEGTTIAQQVQAALEVMGDKKRPMWLDCETPAGLHVDHIREAKREFERRGVRVIGAYSYVPYWEGSIAPGEPDSHEFGAFWVAAYGSNRTGTPANIYPGDSASQWDYPLGNQKPALWQYGSNAQVAG
ncbi:GH25 family lysozyme, partial [Corynebacterium striatum]